MPTDLVPFGNLLEAGFSQLAGASPNAHNVIVDARATMRRRPGITAYNGAVTTTVDANGIYGVYVTNAGQLFAVGGAASIPGGANVYRVTSSGSSNLSMNLTSKVYGPGRPVFAETEMLLCVTMGHEIKRITTTEPTLPIDTLGVPTNATTDPAGAPIVNFVGGVTFVSIAQFPPNLTASAGMTELPPFATHIITNTSRLLANDSLIDKTKIRYSDVASGTTTFAGHDDWTPGANTAGFFSTESNPDPVVALYENTNEVYTFGSRGLQVFTPDAQLVYSTSASIELGCSAPYSIVKRNQAFWWLDHKRRFVFSDGRSFDESIGNPVKPEVEAMDRVDDCYGFLVTLDTVDVIVWVFPSAGRSFAYQPGVGWGNWTGWSEAANNWTTLPITAHCSSVADAKNIVGTRDGRIGMLDFSSSTDFGVRIRAYVETGFLDRGTSSKKRTTEIRLTLQRGQTTASSTPTASLYYRDSLGPWAGPLLVSLGPSGDFQTVVRFRNVGGPYRTRQWRFEFDGSDELVLVKAEEEFRVLSQAVQ
jgi:hypothetical protein